MLGIQAGIVRRIVYHWPPPGPVCLPAETCIILSTKTACLTLSLLVREELDVYPSHLNSRSAHSSRAHPSLLVMAEHRAKKSGLAADIDRKLEQRYDKLEEGGTMSYIMVWLNAIIEKDHEAIASHLHKELHRSLRDGILLCKVINKLLESQGKPPVKFSKKCSSPFVAMGNIEAFCNGCKEYGLKKESLFQSTDLWEGRKAGFLNVIFCIHSLGSLANEQGYPVTYSGNEIKFLDNE
ncbi:hypothetical protein RRG08_061264 [Elysia crispata]|uniref:Calponin-homology (CH) domain-containing protein n=1 Tax=Elysia crispata TaxID=231223 RepID=A0AAE0ZGK7_9GAST|nr:hypothetical protein RRG08_061264 [Elysia crispata]